ncbi:unnamed protein product [Heterosigma akashiwo]
MVALIIAEAGPHNSANHPVALNTVASVVVPSYKPGLVNLNWTSHAQGLVNSAVRIAGSWSIALEVRVPVWPSQISTLSIDIVSWLLLSCTPGIATFEFLLDLPSMGAVPEPKQGGCCLRKARRALPLPPQPALPAAWPAFAALLP